VERREYRPEAVRKGAKVSSQETDEAFRNSSSFQVSSTSPQWWIDDRSNGLCFFAMCGNLDCLSGFTSLTRKKRLRVLAWGRFPLAQGRLLVLRLVLLLIP
jgi:hypothetical protein